MGQSFTKQFAGREPEVRRVAWALGILGSMHEFGARDSMAWSKYITEISGGKTPPLYTDVALADRKGLADLVLDALLEAHGLNELKGKLRGLGGRVLKNLLDEREELKKEIAKLKAENIARLDMEEAETERERFEVVRILQLTGGIGEQAK